MWKGEVAPAGLVVDRRAGPRGCAARRLWTEAARLWSRGSSRAGEAVHLLPVDRGRGGAEAALRPFERLAHGAGVVVGLDEHDADAGLGRGGEHQLVEGVVGGVRIA